MIAPDDFPHLRIVRPDNDVWEERMARRRDRAAINLQIALQRSEAERAREAEQKAERDVERILNAALILCVVFTIWMTIGIARIYFETPEQRLARVEAAEAAR